MQLATCNFATSTQNPNLELDGNFKRNTAKNKEFAIISGNTSTLNNIRVRVFKEEKISWTAFSASEPQN
ncbi:MAG: hypothetical protein F6K62_25485 [Sphaerospermopsis sp. SIO1G2]|nr:hypothetical protein [Sphaerospermopsis sp. SIO1G2]